jgi:hypothetical protein
MHWIDLLAQRIVAEWPQWEAEAEQQAQNEQDSQAATDHLTECVRNCIAWHHANNSRKGDNPCCEES